MQLIAQVGAGHRANLRFGVHRIALINVLVVTAVHEGHWEGVRLVEGR